MVQPDSPMYSPEYSPTSPSQPCYRVVGAMVGARKVLRPPLGHGEVESVDSASDSMLCFIKPPPIRGPPEIHAYTDSDDDVDDEKPEGTDVAALRQQLAALRLRLNNMDECVAEPETDRMELGDRVDNLHKAICFKIKWLAKATGDEDLYRFLDSK